MSSQPPDRLSLITLAEEWFASTERVNQLAAGPSGLNRWFHNRQPNRIDEAFAELSSRSNDLARRAAGALPRQWGVFSVFAGLPLETTLEFLTSRGAVPSGAVGGVYELARKRLPEHRARLVLGLTDRADAESTVEDAVMSLADLLPPTEPERRVLIRHLPGSRRPIAQVLGELDTDTTPVPGGFTLSLTDHGDPGGCIRLHDIVVPPDMRGTGYGSAALTELCRFADHNARTIVADFVPNNAADDDALRVRYANWYARHGFRQNERRPEEWIVFATMTRVPKSH